MNDKLDIFCGPMEHMSNYKEGTPVDIEFGSHGIFVFLSEYEELQKRIDLMNEVRILDQKEISEQFADLRKQRDDARLDCEWLGEQLAATQEALIKLRTAIQRQGTPTRWGSPTSLEDELAARIEDANRAMREYDND